MVRTYTATNIMDKYNTSDGMTENLLYITPNLVVHLTMMK